MLSLCGHMVEGSQVFLFYKGPNPTYEGSPSWPSQLPKVSPPNTIILSGYNFNKWILEGYKHLEHSNNYNQFRSKFLAGPSGFRYKTIIAYQLFFFFFSKVCNDDILGSIYLTFVSISHLDPREQRDLIFSDLHELYIENMIHNSHYIKINLKC